MTVHPLSTEHRALLAPEKITLQHCSKTSAGTDTHTPDNGGRGTRLIESYRKKWACPAICKNVAYRDDRQHWKGWQGSACLASYIPPWSHQSSSSSSSTPPPSLDGLLDNWWNVSHRTYPSKPAQILKCRTIRLTPSRESIFLSAARPPSKEANPVSQRSFDSWLVYEYVLYCTSVLN